MSVYGQLSVCLSGLLNVAFGLGTPAGVRHAVGA